MSAQLFAPPRLAHVCGRSDTGAVRRHNEDRFLVDEALGLAAVADGMGGHRLGAVASADALAVLREAIAAAPMPVPPDAALPEDDPDDTAIDRRWQQAGVLQRAVERANAAL